MSNLFFQRLIWRLPVHRLARPGVHQIDDVVEVLLASRGQVRALGHQLAQETIGVLIAARCRTRELLTAAETTRALKAANMHAAYDSILHVSADDALPR